MYLGTLPDNLDVDMETGDVWIGAHPSFYQFFNHVKNMKEHKSPSHVLILIINSQLSVLYSTEVKLMLYCTYINSQLSLLYSTKVKLMFYCT